MTVEQLKAKYHFSQQGDTLVFDTRLPKASTARGRRKTREPQMPKWAFQPKFKKEGSNWIPDSSSHLIVVKQ